MTSTYSDFLNPLLLALCSFFTSTPVCHHKITCFNVYSKFQLLCHRTLGPCWEQGQGDCTTQNCANSNGWIEEGGRLATFLLHGTFLHVFHYISVTLIQRDWLKLIRNLLQLTGTESNTFIPVPAPLLCVSLILNAVTTNPPLGLGKTGFINIDFTIVNAEEMAKSHQFYYSGMFNIFCMIVINHSHQVQW